MATSVRFYNANIVDGSGNYNDGTVATGAVGKGRFVLAVDPFTAPSGTDGQFSEFDFVVDDPGDATKVFWGWVGVNVATSPALVTGGFTFDAAAPATFDYWFCYREAKATYDAYVGNPANQVPGGATNYARNNALFWDGAFLLQGLGFVVPVNGASVANWWADAPSTTPTITAPAGGTSYTPSDDLTITVTWTEPGTENDSEVTTSGAFVSDSGSLGGAFTHDIVIPYGTSGSITIGVRAKNNGAGWSPYATVTVTVTPVVDTPVSCFEAEALLDTPDLLWLYRDPSPVLSVTDLSGNARNGLLENVFQVEFSTGSDGYQDHSGTPTATVLLETNVTGGGGGASPPAIGTAGYMVVAMLTVYANAVPTLTLPTGWTLLTTEDHSATWQTVGLLLAGPATATYPWSVGLSGTPIFGYGFALQMFPDWLTVRAGSVQNPAAGVANVPAPASWPDFQIQTLAYFTSAGGTNFIDHLTPSTEWSSPPHTSIAGLFVHRGINPTNDTPAITYFTPPATAVPGNLPVWLIQIVLEDVGHVQSPWIGADTGICDAGCADVNGSAAFRYAPLSNNTGTITVPSYDPSTLTSWTVEAASKLFASPLDLVSVGVPALLFELVSGKTRAQEGISGANHGVTIASTGCWMHAIIESSTTALDGYGNKTRLFVNGKQVWASTTAYSLPTSWQVAGGTFGDGVAENGAAVLYPSALSKKRIAAHFSHFCHLCRAGMGFVLGTTTFG